MATRTLELELKILENNALQVLQNLRTQLERLAGSPGISKVAKDAEATTEKFKRDV
jgi:hypothetical protein